MKKRLSFLLALIMMIEVIWGSLGTSITAVHAAPSTPSAPSLEPAISVSANSCSGDGSVGRTPVISLDFYQPMQLISSGQLGGYLDDVTDSNHSMGPLTIQADANQPGHYVIQFSSQNPLQYNHEYKVRVEAGLFQTLDVNPTPSAAVESSFKTIAKGLQSYVPAVNASGINPNGLNLKMTFNEEMTTDAGSIQIVQQSNGSEIEKISASSSQVSISGCEANITLSKTLARDTTYAVKVDSNAFKSKTGVPFEGISSNEWYFTTQWNTTIQSTYPQKNDINVSTGTKFTLNYNHPVNAGSGLIELRRADGSLVKSFAANNTSFVSVNGSQITINLSSGYLSSNTGYYVTVANDAFTDTQGNPVPGITTSSGWNFTTAVDSSSQLTITGFSPANQSTGVAIDSDLYITFNREVYQGTGEVSVRKAGSSSKVPVTVSVSGREVRIRLQPGYTYDYDSTYYVTIERNAFYDAQNYNNQYAGMTSSWVFQTPVSDKQPPVLQSSDMYSNTTIRLTYNKQLYSDSWLSTSAFSVTVNDESRRISYVYTSGDSVYIVLETGIAVGQVVKVSYKGGSNPIRDLYRNQAATFSQREVVNGIDTALPLPKDGYVSGKTLKLNFGQSLKTPSVYAYEQFKVTGDGSSIKVNGISQSGNTLTLTLDSTPENGQIVRVSYTPGAYPIQDNRGMNVAAFTDFLVRNYLDSKPPVFQNAEGADSKVVLNYNELLSTSNVPMKSQFSVLVNDKANFVNKVEIKDNQVILTLATALPKDAKVTVSYVPGTSRLTDLNGNSADYINLQPVTVTGYTLGGDIKSAVIQGDMIQVVFNKAMLSQSSLVTSQFQVMVDGVIRGLSQASISGSTLTIKLSSPVAIGQKVVLSYIPGATPLKDTSGNRLLYFNNISVTNTSTGSGNSTSDPSLPADLTRMDAKEFGKDMLAMGVQSVTVSDVQSRNGQYIKQYTVDGDKLKKVFEYIGSKNEASHTVVIDAASGLSSASVSIPLSALEYAYNNDRSASIAVRAGDAVYLLPLNQVDFTAIARSLNSTTSSVTLNITVEKLADRTASDLLSLLNGGSTQKVTDPVDFHVSARSSSSQEVTVLLKGEYLIRTNTTLQDNRSGLVRVDDAAGKLTFVPAVIDTLSTRKVFHAKVKGNYTVMGVTNYKYFADVGNHWAKDSISVLSSKFIIDARQGNSFEPGKNITRAEFAEYVARGLGLEGDPKTAERFYDVTNSPKSAFIGAAAKAGIITGYTDGSFKPNNPITREQMAIMMTRAMNYAGYNSTLNYSPATYLKNFKDYKSIQSPESAARMVKEGIIQGVTPTTFQPKGYSTRAQATVMLERLLKKIGYL
ncbi:Ig-like domain-containing protein [Paenibacillus sp. KQZ6P-2]|uniref:Ig-like domain-containing protein n=1 Tax=Paenibacillus mangrovi TaxID=2931978 RepID=A0A9X2B6H8_9BACL|nr:Ig-like domain-containing protein [Paenibacillus mangrovi]MCJ8012768.1 Ig-like domain-containing protein [Paenibacillus mangrovi]